MKRTKKIFKTFTFRERSIFKVNGTLWICYGGEKAYSNISFHTYDDRRYYCKQDAIFHPILRSVEQPRCNCR